MELDHDLIKQDIEAVRGFFVKFAKSFGPSPKKVGDKPVGFFEEMYIRFRFWLVNIGPVGWFKTVVVILGGAILYFVLFRHSDPLFMIVTVFLFLWFYVWVWGEELEKEKKDNKQGIDRHFVTIVNGFFDQFKKSEQKDAKKK